MPAFIQQFSENIKILSLLVNYNAKQLTDVTNVYGLHALEAIRQVIYKKH